MFSFLQAQVFTLGPKVGLNFSSINFNQKIQIADTTFNLLTQDAKFGLNGGFFLRFKSKKIYVQPEALFSQHRTSFKVFSNFDSVGEIKEIQYVKLDVPLNIGIKLGKTFRLNGGIVGSYIMSSFVRNEKDVVKYALSITQSNLQWTYLLGIGFDIKKHITIDFKYEGNIGSHISSSTFLGSPSEISSRINNFQLNFGFALIPFKK